MRNFIYKYRVPLSDTDAGGIVYHSNYIVMAERARSELLSGIGMDNAILDAEEISIEYMKPGLSGDMAEVHSSVSSADGCCCIISQTVERGEDILARMQVRAVLRSFPGLEPIPVPKELTEA